jgi:putative pyruvate formate lyase activating enzyme
LIEIFAAYKLKSEALEVSMKPFQIPSYIRLFNEGILQERIENMEARLDPCILCPHQCLANRKSNHTGNCHTGEYPFVASYGPHFGEEPPLLGFRGSGTIFFSNCNLSCIFCQNYDISQLGTGQIIDYENLADMMIDLQTQGCHNINLVTPTHVIHALMKALPRAIENGLRVPLVYNSGGYDSVETIRLLEGVFDIYMPDLKYFNNQTALELSGIPNYVDNATKVIREMHRQVGDLILDEQGIAVRGMIVRHLILPGNLADTNQVIDFICTLSGDTYLNLMDQYRPEYHAYEDPRLGRRITAEEFNNAINYAKKSGLRKISY